MEYKQEKELAINGLDICGYLRQPISYNPRKNIIKGTCSLDKTECHGGLPLLCEDCNKYNGKFK